MLENRFLHCWKKNGKITRICKNTDSYIVLRKKLQPASILSPHTTLCHQGIGVKWNWRLNIYNVFASSWLTTFISNSAILSRKSEGLNPFWSKQGKKIASVLEDGMSCPPFLNYSPKHAAICVIHFESMQLDWNVCYVNYGQAI